MTKAHDDRTIHSPGAAQAAALSDFDTGKLAGAVTPRGVNMTSASGRPLFLLDPNPDEITIEDIAAHLSRMCRFNGALRSDVEIYTVAQHSCLVSDHCPPEHRLEGLLHDAHEYLTGDVIKPTKLNLALEVGRDVWEPIEHRAEAAVRRRFGLPDTMTPAVKKQDYLAVATEHRDLQFHIGVDWGNLPDPWPETIEPWGVFRARREFLQRFRSLYDGL